MQHGVSIPSMVKLNGGGHYFTTSLQTLTKDPNSMLAVMFSGKFDMKPAEDGAFFIDRDGTHFRFILNYLRTGQLSLPEGTTALKELEAEAKFYQIQGILAELRLMTESLTCVKLDVGGHFYTTSLQTLTKDPSSRLAAMFSGKHSNYSVFFIDRDGKHFRHILNFLRNGELLLPKGAKFINELDKLRESEILLNDEHLGALRGWLYPLGKRVFQLLFRASRDGLSADAFHSRCDNKGATVTIVQSENSIFGGFTEQPWKSNGGHMERTQAFLFSLANPHGQRPTKVPLNSGRQGFAIYCDSCNGPTFGRSEYYCTPTTALSISHDQKRRGESQSNDIYEFPRSVSYLFTGLPFFLVTNYEVFGLYD